MTWMGGYDGTLFSRDEVKRYIDSIPKEKLAYIKFLTLHNTGAPNMAQEDATPGGESARMRNIAPGYKAKGWPGGPRFVVFNSGRIGKGTPLEAGPGAIHSPSWNKTSIGIEMCADFDGTDDPTTGAGALIVDTTAYLFALLLTKLGLPADGMTIRLHKEDPRTTHDCPGHLVKKADFIAKVAAYMGQTYVRPGLEPGPKRTQLFDIKEIQERLAAHGFDPGPIDGILGKQTDFAIRAFQTSLKIGPTGVIGPWSMERLRKAPKPAVAPPVAAKPDVPVSPPPATVMVYQPGQCKWSEEWCLPMMKKVEGFRLKAYSDKPGWAIGYGHNSTSGVPPITCEGMELKSEKEAEDILRADLNDRVRYVNAWVKVPLTQGQVDALCMHIFQQGPTQFRKRVLPTINEGKHDEAAKLIETMAHDNPGVMRRRRFEAARYRGEKPMKW